MGKIKQLNWSKDEWWLEEFIEITMLEIFCYKYFITKWHFKTIIRMVFSLKWANYTNVEKNVGHLTYRISMFTMNYLYWGKTLLHFGFPLTLFPGGVLKLVITIFNESSAAKQPQISSQSTLGQNLLGNGLSSVQNCRYSFTRVPKGWDRYRDKGKPAQTNIDIAGIYSPCMTLLQFHTFRASVITWDWLRNS